MANYRALTIRNGFHATVLNADVVDVGSGIDVNVAGPMTIGGVKQNLLTLGKADALITLNPDTGVGQFNALSVTINGNVIVAQALATLGFFGFAGNSKATITGNLTAVADVNVKNILTSMLAAFAAQYGLVTSGVV